MGLEVVTDIGGLVTTNPTAADSKNQGDDHFRLIKTCLVNLSRQVLHVVTTYSGTAVTAIAGEIANCTNAGLVTYTLPASPTAGDLYGVCFQNGGITNVVARNGNNITGAAANLTASAAQTKIVLRVRYVDVTMGYVLEAY